MTCRQVFASTTRGRTHNGPIPSSCFRVFAVLAAAAALTVSSGWAAGPAPVAAASARGDREAVRTLLKDGGDVNAAQGDGMTALHWAALDGDAQLASMLLYAGANVKATTRLGGYAPLHLAAREGQAAVVTALLAAGADPAARTSTGATALMLAAASGNTEAVAALLEHGADPNAKEAAYGQTALMFAAALDRTDVVRLLVKRGADTAAASTFVDLKALGFAEPATFRGQQQLPDTEDKAKGPAPEANARPSAAAREANAANAGHEGAPRGDRTGSKGPDAKKPDVPGMTRPFRYNELVGAQGGLTALHFAARQGNLRTVQALVDAGASVNEVSPGDHTSALLIATINGQFDTAMYLLDKGADPNLANDAGVTPLYAAVNVQWAPKAAYPQPRAYLQQKATYLDLMAALLDRKADPNARLNRKVWFASYNFDQSSIDEIGATAFWRAAYAADVDAMKLLVKYGADPDIPTVKAVERRDPDFLEPARDLSGLPQVPPGGPNMSPLHAAAGPGYAKGFAANSHHYAPAGLLPAVKYLVDVLHADVNARDADGNTPLHNAASRGDNEMIEYLVSKGADVTFVNRGGQTTIDVANGPVQRTQPYPETIALLEKLGARNNHRCVSCN